jgi:transposase
MQGKKDYQEKLFTSFQLSNYVPADNFYRRLKDLLDLRWLYKATEKYYGTEGQKSIDPVVFLKLMLIGYLENLGSDRRIIATARMRLDMLYFLGYDLDEQLPWHSTLSRTRQVYGEEVFKELFLQVLRGCIEKGMVAGKRQAMDSVLVKANASMDSLREKEIIEDAAAYTKELREDDEQSSSNNDEDGRGNHGENTVSAYKRKEVEWHHQWKAKAYHGQPGGRKQNEEGTGEEHTFLPKYVSNHTHYSTTDHDARVAVKPGKPRQLNYLSQVSVDTASHVITQIQADYADKKDSQCLPALLTNTIQNLKAEGLLVEEVLADASYSSGEALKSLEANGITGYIPNFGQYKPFREGFTYHSEGDYYTCERGVHLPYKKTYSDRKGYRKKQYRSSAKDCAHCPLRTTCIGARADFKKIDETIDKPLYDCMHQRLQTPKAKRLKKLRQSTVEPVLGTLVNFLAMKRMNTRGLDLANKCMLMAAACYNLKKLLKFNAPKAGAQVMKMFKRAENSLKMALFFLFAAMLLPQGWHLQKQLR